MTRQSKRIEVALEGASEAVVRKLNVRVFQSLTSATPVDLGFARASLTPSTGTPIAEPLTPPTGVGTASRPGPNRATAKKDAASRFSKNKAKATTISNTYKLSQGPVFFAYRAPYVVFLNEGSSSQAPKKFIERAVSAAIRSL